MQEVLTAKDLCKSFRLSRKQQQMEKTKERIKVAVDHLSFSVYGGEVFGLLGPQRRR